LARAINSAGLALVKEYEGLKLKAYLCPAGVWTIGHGTTKYPDGRKVKDGDTCTPEQAELWLEFDLQSAERAVSSLVRVPLTDNQFSALVSFVYNLGAGAFGGSTLLKRINERAPDALIAAHFKSWVFANKKQLPGLVRRRAAEAALWGIK
jgi:lysozyme